MAKVATKRIQNEIKELKGNNAFDVEIVSGSMHHMTAKIAGPPDSPYTAGHFKLDIHLPEKYPFSPPRIRFLTKVWHPNISVSGLICLDILQDKWDASLSVRSVLLSLQALLQDPCAKDPLEIMPAVQYMSNIEVYKKTAAYWTAVYAASNSEERSKFPEFERQLKVLKDRIKDRVSEDQLILALSQSSWKLEEAVRFL